MKTKNGKMLKAAMVLAFSAVFGLGAVALPRLVGNDEVFFNTFAANEDGGIVSASEVIGKSDSIVKGALVSSSDEFNAAEVSTIGEVTGLTADVDNFYIGESYQIKPILSGGDLVPALKWTSSNGYVVKVDSTGNIQCLKKGTARVYAQVSNNKKVSIYIKVVDRMESMSFESEVYLLTGKTKRFVPKTIAPKGCTDSITWSVSDTSIAEVTSNGIMAVSKGDVTITATSGSGVTADFILHCIEPAKSVAIDSDVNYVYVSETLKLNEIISPDTSNDIVSWISSNKKIATIEADGTVTGIKKGSVTITARSLSGKYAKKTVKVVNRATELKFAKPAYTMYTGKTYTNSLTVLPKWCGDGITYSSSDPDVATINSNGKVTPLKAGDVTITATSGSGVTASYDVHCILTVKTLKITAPKTRIYVDEPLELTPEFTPVESNDTFTWKSSNLKVMTIDSNGMITPLKFGYATITVRASSGRSAQLKVYVVKPSTEIGFKKSSYDVIVGKTVSTGINVKPLGCGDMIYYTSSDPSVATVDMNGKVHGLAVGDVEITATSGSGLTSTCTVRVTPVALTKISTTYRSSVKAGNSLILTASYAPASGVNDDYRLQWVSSNESVAKVEWISENQAKVYGLKAGVSYITIKSPVGNAKYTCIVNVTKTPDLDKIALNSYDESIELDGSFRLTWTPVPAEAITESRYLTVYSADTSIAEIDEDGNITPKAVGDVDIVCEASDGSCRSVLKLHVYPVYEPVTTLSIDGESVVYSSEDVTLTAIPDPQSGVNPLKPLKWTTSDETVATVNSSGVLTADIKGISFGTATITAEAESGVVAAFVINVKLNEPLPESVVPDETEIVIPVNPNGGRKLTAVVYPEEAADRNVHWVSLDPDIATVTIDGYVTGHKEGVAVIQAVTCDHKTADVTVNVVKGGLVYLSPSRQDANMYYGRKTTEYEQMYKVAAAARRYLEAAGYEVYTAPYELKLVGRDEEARALNAACYVAIHSNAGNKSIRGTEVFYYTQLDESKRLADILFKHVGGLTPTKDRGVYGNDNYKETHLPGEKGIPSILLEVEFHDCKAGAEWIMSHTDEIGKSIADGIIEYMLGRS